MRKPFFFLKEIMRKLVITPNLRHIYGREIEYIFGFMRLNIHCLEIMLDKKKKCFE